MAESELHALVVKIEGDLSGLRAELKSGKDDVAGFGKQTAAVFAGSLLADGAKAMASAVLDFAKTLSVDSVQAALESEAAVTRLNTALKLSGQYSASTSQALQGLASELQATTKYEDDAIINAQGLIQSLGKLSEDGLKQATRAAVDLSAGLGIDLQQAALMVGKAAAGETGTFARYGLKIEEAGSKAEVFARTMKVVNEQLGGSAAAQAKTFGGALEQLKNTFGDTQEEIGKLVTDNEVFATVVVEVTKHLRKFADLITENKDELSKFAAEGLIYVIDGLTMLGTVADTIGRTIRASLAATEAAILGVGAAFAEVASWVDDDWSRTADSLKAATASAAADVGKSLTEDTKLGDATVMLAELGNTARGSLEEMQRGWSGAAGEIMDLTEGVRNLAAESDRAAEAGKKLADKLAGEGAEEQMNAKLELLKAQREAELVTQQEYDMKSLELLNTKLATEVALIEAAHAQGKIGEQQYLTSITALNDKYRVDKAKADLQAVKTEQQLSKEREANMRSSLGSISTLMQSSSSELFAIGKAAAMAQATIDGVAAVQKALAAAPPPFNFALAALVGVAQASNLARIASTQPPKFAQGGTVPGFGYQDSQMVVAAPGEEIIDRSTSKRFREFMARAEAGAIGGGGGTAHVQIEFVGDAVELLEAKILRRQQLDISLLGASS